MPRALNAEQKETFREIDTALDAAPDCSAKRAAVALRKNSPNEFEGLVATLWYVGPPVFSSTALTPIQEKALKEAAIGTEELDANFAQSAPPADFNESCLEFISILQNRIDCVRKKEHRVTYAYLS